MNDYHTQSTQQRFIYINKSLTTRSKSSAGLWTATMIRRYATLRVGVGVTRMAAFHVKQCQKNTTNRQILTDSNDDGAIYKLSIHIHSHSHILILHRMYMIYVNLPF
jgi:hypothetical protein